LINTSSPLCAQGVSTIKWGKPLTFQDFESRPTDKDTAAADISVTIMLGYSSTRDGHLKLKVAAVIDKDKLRSSFVMGR